MRYRLIIEDAQYERPLVRSGLSKTELRQWVEDWMKSETSINIRIEIER